MMDFSETELVDLMQAVIIARGFAEEHEWPPELPSDDAYSALQAKLAALVPAGSAVLFSYHYFGA